MAPKRKSSVQTDGSKKGRLETEEEDSFRSTAEALKAAPADQRIIRVDPACPFSRNPKIQVSCTHVQPTPSPPLGSPFLAQWLKVSNKLWIAYMSF